MKQQYTIYGSGSFISAFRDSMRQEMLNYYTNLPSYLTNTQTPDESFKQKSIEIMKGNELEITITNRSGSYGNSRVYRYKVNGESVLRFDQIPYPECCGIAIIKNFSCNSDLSKADFTEAMTKFTEDLVANDRFSRVLFYTTRGSNGDRYFQQFDGITILDSFQNRRSGNMLVGFEIDLLKLQPEPEKILLPYEDDDFDEPTEGDDAVASDLDLEIRLADQRLAEHRATLNIERRLREENILPRLGSTQSNGTITPESYRGYRQFRANNSTEVSAISALEALSFNESGD